VLVELSWSIAGIRFGLEVDKNLVASLAIEERIQTGNVLVLSNEGLHSLVVQALEAFFDTAHHEFMPRCEGHFVWEGGVGVVSRGV